VLSCDSPRTPIRHRFPALRTAQSVSAAGASCISGIELPAATAIGSLNLDWMTGLDTLDLGALTPGQWQVLPLDFFNPADGAGASEA
jgi:hypothetical protein